MWITSISWITHRFCIVAIAMFPASPSFSSELQLSLGGLHASPHSEPSYSLSLEYRRPCGAYLSCSFAWINEGHVPGHHRDGQAIQLWWHTAQVMRGPIFQVGLGPYRFSNTTVASNMDGYSNAHGWGLAGSAGVAWHMGSNWLASLRINRIYVHDNFRSTAVLAGMGYRFGSSGDDTAGSWLTRQGGHSGHWEFDAMVGANVVNSFHSDLQVTKAIGIRRRATDWLTGSLTYFSEGGGQQGQRTGIAPQIWLEDDLTSRFSMGVGIGPHLAIHRPTASDGSSSAVSALISISAAYAITSEWIGRLTWNRVETRYDRDSDIVTFALGYRY